MKLQYRKKDILYLKNDAVIIPSCKYTSIHETVLLTIKLYDINNRQTNINLNISKNLRKKCVI